MTVEKIAYVSLGCAKNLVDTEVMLGELQEAGYELIEEVEDADYIIINTCTFIEKAKAESINTILEAARFRTEGTCKGLIVAGCLSQQYQEELFTEIPEIDALLGTGSWNHILEALDAVKGGQRACFMDSMSNIYDERMPRLQTTPSHQAYIKISEGCNNACTFCIIPKVRGRYRSRTIESIVKEATHLAAHGVKEITLIAQDSTAYGTDLNNGKPLLVDLLKELVKIEDVQWVRLMYMYPRHFTDELLDFIIAEPKMCKYVDMPLQHINDDMLRRMNRKDDRAAIERLVSKIRNASVPVTLRTTFIVGFPGETEEQFEELCDFVETFKFDQLGVFTYSQEEGTPAGEMEDQVDEAVKEDRYHKLMAIQAAVSEERNRALEGTVHQGLIESVDEENGRFLATGRLAEQAPEVDGVMYIEDCEGLKVGDIVMVRVVQGFAYDVLCERV